MTTNQNLHAVNGTPVNINGPNSLDTFTPEETLKQMEELIKENNELKEAIKQTNHAMKERYEELATWREKQREDREYIQQKFEEAKNRLMVLTAENEALKKAQAQNAGSSQGISKDDLLNEGMSSNLLEQDVQQLKAQIHRLQTEKADLVAMNSELLVKMGAASSEDSFVEIRMVEAMDDAELKSKELESKDSGSPPVYNPSVQVKTHDNSEKCLSEELTVRQLLHMLRDKTPEKEKRNQMPPNQSPNEVEVLKSQVMSISERLAGSSKKLDEAEDMKKTLEERCLELEQKLASNEIVVEDMIATRKLTQMQAAYDNLFKDYSSFMKINEEMKIKESKQMETLNGLIADLDIAKRTIEENQKTIDQLTQTVAQQADELSVQSARNADLVDISAQLEKAEKALVEKQQKIDTMKQTIIKQQEEEMETVAVFKAQAEVYSADFHAERAAREAIHAEKESMAERLELLMKENTQLKEELDTLGRQSLVELQRRHGSCGSVAEDDEALQHRGVREPRNSGWEHQGMLQEHACPKCGSVLPDIDTLQIHVMDCII
ncbi:optineurin [Pristis pectinata]|uniref:optineurin n=1 Tax=Pristis pectinata TaxID=685728 RepID=UPI00223D19D8|nr:optineurin [Pristis pectinata]